MAKTKFEVIAKERRVQMALTPDAADRYVALNKRCWLRHQRGWADYGELDRFRVRRGGGIVDLPSPRVKRAGKRVIWWESDED